MYPKDEEAEIPEFNKNTDKVSKIDVAVSKETPDKPKSAYENWMSKEKEIRFKHHAKTNKEEFLPYKRVFSNNDAVAAKKNNYNPKTVL